LGKSQNRFSRELTVIIGVLLITLSFSACGWGEKEREARKRVTPIYDEKGKLTVVKYDADGDGKIDTVAYMDGSRVIRIEHDRDQDGKVDRWEYYAADGRTLERVGLSTHHDGKPNRVEFYEGGRLVRTEEDTDGDGRPDKWETFDGARLASVAFDTTHRRGKPDRRLVYGLDGAARLEVDPAGTGTFTPAAARPAAAR